MFRSAIIPAFAMLATGGAGALVAAPAEAREHGRIVRAQGPYGGGYVAGRHVSRQPGSTQVTRGAATYGGRGYGQTRSTQWGDGAVTNSVDRRYANGTGMSRDSSLVRNGDGSVSVQRDRTGPAGNSQSGWSTIYRTDDGYTRTRSGATSSGRSYSATRDVSVNGDSVTVDRNAATGSGRAVSSTRTYSRRD
ncbi:hypothetical protein SLG_03080 [Sphingobium sp. SYK-6]|uniref:hypothetical protein n=1 Tax=Sphingobium sp. (strain NBRC 103272 / SYK-6) TaxID=627192 RepID=UPI0002276D65|nr:hypothetical protein [Sphingobium sp. SYK-6]BAK64983.1 hypothetical protein SLG_03080 [Sphingobium sp. SYK-6]